MNILDEIGNEQIAKHAANKDIPDFGPGDTVRVNVKVVEGTRERIQAFEGVCLGRANRGVNSSFTVRKISHGEGVERVFPLYSPRIDSIEVVRRGRVRRAKLYYLRGRTGKKARIAEKQEPHRGAQPKVKATAKTDTAQEVKVKGEAKPKVEKKAKTAAKKKAKE